MSQQVAIYRSADNRRWLRLTRSNIWLAPDHLLLISNRLFRENYARIYWSDIETMVVYSLPHPRGSMLAIEILCLLAAAVCGLLVNARWGITFAVLFLLPYLIWRFTRPYYACQITTKLSTYRFPLLPTLAGSKRIVADLKTRTELAQSSLIDSSPSEAINGSLRVEDRNQASRKPPMLVPYIATFGLGLLGSLSKVILGIYFIPLISLFFLPRNFEFPFNVRAAAVMSQILGALQIAWWLILLRYPLAVQVGVLIHPGWEFHILRILFSLFGVLAVFERSLDHSRYQARRQTVLGLS